MRTNYGWMVAFGAVALLGALGMGCQEVGAPEAPTPLAVAEGPAVQAAEGAPAEGEAKPCCHGKDKAAAAAEAEAEDSPAVAEPAGESIYALEGTFTDQEGRETSLDVFEGHPTAIVMFYGSCASACPILVNDLKRYQEALPDDVRAASRVLLVTLDAANDTPERLAEYAKQYEMPTDRWRLVRGDEALTRALALVLGVKYRQLDNGHISHSNFITLLDARGAIAFQLEGLAQPVDELVERTVGLARAPAPAAVAPASM